jgi:3-hydroxyacyl-CoA dehydrogenase / enoyl-CoA hydratase / 3-hydroxybutyryl-CoA epimerase
MNPDKLFRISCEKPLQTEFADRLEAAIADSGTTAILIDFHRGPEPSGSEVEQIIAADPVIDRLRVLIRKMEQGAKPVIGLVSGSVKGLQLEVMLACHARFANSEVFELEFPLVEYGLMPILGGTQRLPRICGIEFAVGILLTGRSITTAEAATAGLVQINDQDLVKSTLEWAETHPTPVQPWDMSVPEDLPAFSQTLPNRQLLEQAYLKMRRRITPEDAAPAAILRCLHDGLERSIDAGIRLEAEQWSIVRRSRSTLNRVNTLYRARQRAIQRPANERHSIQQVGVLGAGLMGTGIAYAAARAGYSVRVVDVSNEVCGQSLERMQKIALRDRKIDPQPKEPSGSVLGRVQWTSEIDALAGCELIVEAIFEDAALKKSKIAEISDLADPSALIASNTTTLPISDLALACTRPERFLGTHFFAPVDRMDLLEIVMGQKTASGALHGAFLFGRQLGKTPIVVRDGPGFFTSRVVAAYLQEALFMIREGVSPWMIDNVAQNAGMIVGPLAVADLMSLDLLKAIFDSLAKFGRGAARNADDAAEVLNEFISRSRLGRKTGTGIFDYNDHEERVDPVEFWKIFPPAAVQPAPVEIEQRLFAIQTIEALHAMREGIIDDGSLADLASVLGWSYPACRGGVIAYIEHVGRAEFERICIALNKACGDRFAIPA